jgi:hypothetical protein
MNKHFCWILNVETECFNRKSCKIAGREENIVNKYLCMWVAWVFTSLSNAIHWVIKFLEVVVLDVLKLHLIKDLIIKKAN